MAKPQALESVTARGILEETFAGKLRECASIVLEKLDGDLAAVVRGPIDRAKRSLCLFPGIGEPGAERILLFSGREALLAPESNALRVLCRLGLVQEEKSYAATYAAGRDVAKDLPAKPSVLQEAHLLLQQHGQVLCKRSAPRCEECPLFPACEYAAASRSAREQRVAQSKRKGTSTRGRGRRRLP
jgi:endonuclease III